MSSVLRKLLCVSLVCLTSSCVAKTQSAEAAKVTDETIRRAQTTTYCEVLKHPERFKNSMIRVRALYETDFEKSIITAPPCDMSALNTWVDFDKRWESHSKRRVRRALLKLKWGVQADVVFVGLFKSDGHYGHMDMYLSSMEVYKVEEVRASGGFQPMPEQDATR
jgi:hypothetical protein